MTLSYWQKLTQVKKDTPHGKLQSYRSYDIVVIGAGLIGIATAYYLKQLGCNRALVLERDLIGFSASGRNAGFLKRFSLRRFLR